MEAKTGKAWVGDRRGAFTVTELLVCLFVIAVLAALLLPAVQAAREASRRSSCAANLRQIGIAIGAYESTHAMFPPGGGYGASMHVFLLPYLDQRLLYDQYDFVKRDDSRVKIVALPLYLCPSESAPPTGSQGTPQGGRATSYAGNSGTGVLKYGYNGLFRHLSSTSPPLRDGPVRASDVRDGLSNTAAVSEIQHTNQNYERLRVNWHTPEVYRSVAQFDEFAEVCMSIPEQPSDYGWQGDILSRGMPWTYGDISLTMYNHVLTPNQPSCLNNVFVQTAIVSAGSGHRAGVNVVFADGHLQFIGDSVDAGVWRQFGSRVESDLIVSN